MAKTTSCGISNQNTGRHPHSAASYPIIQGDAAARLTAPGTLTNGAAEQQTPCRRLTIALLCVLYYT